MMDWRTFTRWLPHTRSRSRAAEPGAALFHGLRIRLTLWYCGVLCAALVLFGVALYVGTQYFLLSPIQQDAGKHADVHTQDWLTGAVDHACPLFGQGGPQGMPRDQGFLITEQVACFDANGQLLPGESTIGLPAAFFSSALVQEALRTGRPQSDIVNTGGSTGQVYRYVVPVPNLVGGGYAGALLVGESVNAQETALALLLTLLLSIGGVALLGAGVGGLFLANRALVPARLAWTNQQRFIADAAHELRTPLTLMRADAEVLLRGRKHMEVDDAALLEDIVAEAHHMSNLATNLLTLARLDNNALHLEHEVLSLTALAEEGQRRVRALAEQKGVTVRYENSGEAHVVGDPVLLQQAMLVLLDNALKYNHPGGSVTMRTLVEHQQALLEVRDTGVGIAAEHLSLLGERFYRVDKARSREAGGTGLGLSIARGIATAHGGQLTLSSVPDQGTTARLSLPLAYASSPESKTVGTMTMLSLPESQQ